MSRDVSGANFVWTAHALRCGAPRGKSQREPEPPGLVGHGWWGVRERSMNFFTNLDSLRDDGDSVREAQEEELRMRHEVQLRNEKLRADAERNVAAEEEALKLLAMAEVSIAHKEEPNQARSIFFSLPWVCACLFCALLPRRRPHPTC